MCICAADLETPISAFLKLRNGGEAYLLESVEGGEKLGRYSFIGTRPTVRVRAYDRQVEVWQPTGRIHVEADPLEVARGLLARYRPVPHPGLPRFYGGAVGYFGYDCVRLWERLPNRPPDTSGLPTCYLVITDAVVIFDHVTHAMRIVANAMIGDDAGKAYQAAVETIEAIYDQLRAAARAAGGDRPHRADDGSGDVDAPTTCGRSSARGSTWRPGTSSRWCCRAGFRRARRVWTRWKSTGRCGW